MSAWLSVCLPARAELLGAQSQAEASCCLICVCVKRMGSCQHQVTVRLHLSPRLRDTGGKVDVLVKRESVSSSSCRANRTLPVFLAWHDYETVNRIRMTGTGSPRTSTPSNVVPSAASLSSSPSPSSPVTAGKWPGERLRHSVMHHRTAASARHPLLPIGRGMIVDHF